MDNEQQQQPAPQKEFLVGVGSDDGVTWAWWRVKGDVGVVIDYPNHRQVLITMNDGQTEVARFSGPHVGYIDVTYFVPPEKSSPVTPRAGKH